MGADRRSDRGAGFDFKIIVTCGLCGRWTAYAIDFSRPFCPRRLPTRITCFSATRRETITCAEGCCSGANAPSFQLDDAHIARETKPRTGKPVSAVPANAAALLLQATMAICPGGIFCVPTSVPSACEDRIRSRVRPIFPCGLKAVEVQQRRVDPRH